MNKNLVPNMQQGGRAFKVQKPDQDIVRNVQTMGPASLLNQNVQPDRDWETNFCSL